MVNKERAVEIYNFTCNNTEIEKYICDTIDIVYEGKRDGFIDYKKHTILEVVAEMLIELYYDENWNGQESEEFDMAAKMHYDYYYDEALDAAKDNMAYEKDIYAYYGVRRSDF